MEKIESLNIKKILTKESRICDRELVIEMQNRRQKKW